MTPRAVFDLPQRLAAKAAPERIAADEIRFREIADAVAGDIAAVESTLQDTLAHRAGDAQGRVEREATVDHCHRRPRGLHSFRNDAVLGRTSPADGSAPLYVGRLGVNDPDGRPLLVDWRSPAAEPFFAATRARPLGLRSRRRYRWATGTVRDYWDESLLEGEDGAEQPGTSPDQESALISSLTRARGSRMNDVLTTIAADQDAIIRADARRPLVVDGGPGTGKTVVALHRAAYLLYNDRRVRAGSGGVLFVGPHHPYLHYVADVLPGLGEDDVATCTLADMVPESAMAPGSEAPAVAALKGRSEMVAAVYAAVAMYEEPPTVPLDVQTDWGTVQVDAQDWAEAFAAVDPGEPHNLARPQILEALSQFIADRLAEEYGEHPSVQQVRASLVAEEDLVAMVHRAWPLLRATDVLGDLYEVPAYLARCAPALTAAEVASLQRSDPRAWTAADLPLLDAARYRLGDPTAEARERRQQASRSETVQEVELLVDYLIEPDSSEMKEMSMLRGQDLRNALEDTTVVETPPPDSLAGPFAHVVVDEAQELTDAQWAMILRRCPSRSLTVVGDRAQAAHGFTGSWAERLAALGLNRVEVATLSINYRTPQEIMEQAAPVILAAVPQANVPTSIRTSGVPVRHGRIDQLREVIGQWLDAHQEGTACVIGRPDLPGTDRVLSLSPALAKGLEFDLVVLVEPGVGHAADLSHVADAGRDLERAVARYVSMTRATRELVILGPT